VEIYRVSDPAVFDWLDAYEGYTPDRPARSLFLRQLTPLHRPRLWAWVYHLNHSLKLLGIPRGVPPGGQRARRGSLDFACGKALIPAFFPQSVSNQCAVAGGRTGLSTDRTRR
jgi:hypothetical protein